MYQRTPWLFILTACRGSENKEIICYANRIFMAFFPRNSVNFYCATWNARALNCYATALLCNSIGHGRGLDRVFGCLNVLSPARYDFWPGYKAGTHLFILVFLAGSHFVFTSLNGKLSLWQRLFLKHLF